MINGGKKPVIEEKDEFKVTIPYLMAGPFSKTTEKTTEKKETTTEKILSALRTNPSLTAKELANICNITEDGAFYNLKRLKEKGKIERQGADRGGIWIVKD